MKRLLPIILLLFISGFARGQDTRANSFECMLNPGYQGFSKNEIIAFICKSHFENFRLLDKRVTLTFDNGFDIILLSAKELQQSGLLTDISAYLPAFPPDFKLPAFHINQSGQIAAAYPVNSKVKYAKAKR